MSGRPSIVIDDFIRVLSHFPGSPPGALAFSLLWWFKATQQGWSISPLKFIKSKPALGLLWVLVALRTLNKVASRLSYNNGVWKRDRPNWKKEIIVITGGSRGIGAGFVQRIARNTRRIAVLDMVPPSFNLPGVKYYKCDITDREAVHEVAEKIRAELGHPTILVNNAGISTASRLLDYTEQNFLKTYKISILGSLFMVQEFLPNMIKNNHGHVQMVGSLSAYMSVPQLGEYCCTKSAAVAFHEVLTQELKHRYNAPRVRTSLVCPNKVTTDLGNCMAPNAMEFFNPTLTVPEVADRMARHVESGLSGYSVMPGLIGNLGIFAKALPPWFYGELARQGQLHRTITEESMEHGHSKMEAGSVLTLNGILGKASSLTK